MFDKKWFRFVVALVITVAVIGLFLALDVAYMDTGTDDIINVMLLGSVSMVGTLLIYLCFDQMQDWREGMRGVLRTVLLIVGILIIAAFGGFFAYFSGYAAENGIAPAASPWLQGFVACWLVGGELTYVLYGLKPIKELSALFPFVPIISVAAGYVVGVIFAYIGGATVMFCYWIPFILVVLGVIVIIARAVKKKRKRAEEERKKRAMERNACRQALSRGGASSQSRIATASAEIPDTRKAFNGEGPVKSAVYRNVVRDPLGCLADLNNNELKNLSVRVSIIRDVRIEYSGTFIYDASGTSIHYEESMAESDFDTTIRNILRKTEEAYEEVCDEYSGYEERDVRVSTSGIRCVIKR